VDDERACRARGGEQLGDTGGRFRCGRHRGGTVQNAELRIDHQEG
jgi:hypothetical protein